MKIQSKIFVLFLFTVSLVSTRTWAQTAGTQPKHELDASRDTRWLEEEIQRNQPVVSEAQIAEKRSNDALHWTAAEVNQRSQYRSAVSTKPVRSQKMASTESSVYKQVIEPIKTMKKPANHSL